MKYDGGKNGSGVFQRLICMMPPHSVYIEMFLGSGAILRRKKPAAQSFAYELDKRAIWEIQKHLPADRFEPSPINAEWKSPADPLPGCGGTSIVFRHAGKDAQALEIYNIDAFEAIRAKFVASSYFWGLNDPASAILYADPPYPVNVRSWKKPVYKFELMAENEHLGLLKLLLSVPCKVMISGYDNDLYNDTLKGWRKETIATVTRRGRAIETVWLNFPEPVELHDYSHTGDNFRDRWRFEKRLRNWIGQLEKMRPAERGAMLERLAAGMDAFNEDDRKFEAAAAWTLQKKAAAFEKNNKREILTPNPALSAADRPLFE